MRIQALLFLAAAAFAADVEPRKLVVLSVDGLDHRYLASRAQLGLRIPNMSRIVEEGWWAEGGMVGVVPTVTWPSHTTMITGVRPAQHGILANRRPSAEGGEYYWSANLLKAKTLWHVLAERSRTSAAITWPVTVDAAITWNLPEYFRERNGGAMDLNSILERATPGLGDAIAAAYPSFPTYWMDDRTRALAAVWLLRHRKPDLLLVHFVDHDSDAHAYGPFGREAKARLEYTDELIGMVLNSLPPNSVIALVGDHGFERVERDFNLPAWLKARGVTGEVNVQGGWLATKDSRAIAALEQASREPGSCVGRRVPDGEVRRFLPEFDPAAAVWEPAPGCYFVSRSDVGELFLKPAQLGRHGHWPNRYRAAFALWGAGVSRGRGGELDMLELASRFAALLGLERGELGRQP
jgi:predicted AlkP superfamily pyrophosphatase or phosphodiesterase